MDTFITTLVLGLLMGLVFIGIGVRLGATMQRQIDRERHVRHELKQYPELREII